jgi:uncharacterized protein (TIGR02996 family)
VHAPLLDAIAAAPDDPAPWAVYADLLQTQDHPRGELISLMMERERRPSARLLEAQRKQLAVHAPALLPSTLSEIVVGWRRGFVNEIRVAAPEQLATVRSEVSLRFVETATLAIDVDQWAEWRAALSIARMPWRRVRVELINGEDELEVAPILACAPALQTLHIDAGGTLLTWDDARGETLEQLVLVNAGEVSSLDDAELPRLEDLRLIGDSVASDELQTSLCWSRLKRVVVTEAFEEDEEREETTPVVQVITPIAGSRANPREVDDDYDDDDEERDSADLTTAFVVVGQVIQPALLAKLASRMSIANLSARVATVRWLPREVTVFQLFGSSEIELMPYGLAIALETVLDPAPPIALVEVEANRAARYLVLGKAHVRGTQQANPDEVVRRALDLSLGFDPGSGILQDMLDELAATPTQCLLGKAGGYQLSMVDPSSAPLVVPEEPDNDYDDEEDEYGSEEEWDSEDGLEEQYAEPAIVEDVIARAAPVIVERKIVFVTEAPVAEPVQPIEPVEPVEPEIDDDDAGLLDVLETALALDRDTEDALTTPPDRSELWLEFHEHWDDRAVAIDDETHETRWPDPEVVLNEFPHDLARRVAEPTCARHARALEDCRGCDALHCVECGGEDWCANCFTSLVEQAAIDLAAKRVP